MQFFYVSEINKLRNHEVFHISKVKKRKDIQDADKWIYIPGAWRTKSKNEHYAFPLYPDWIKKYDLLKISRKCKTL